MLQRSIVPALQAVPMTATAELERIARSHVPPPRAENLHAIVVEVPPFPAPTVYGLAWYIDGVRPSAPIFAGSQSDVARLFDIFTGRATSRRAPDSPAAVGPRRDDPDQGLPEAPRDQVAPRTRGAEPATTPDPAQQAVAGASTVRLCAGCDQPLPEGSRPNRRTHDGACRVRAARRRAAAKAGRGDTDSGTGPVTVLDSVVDPASRKPAEAASDTAGVAVVPTTTVPQLAPETPELGGAGVSSHTATDPALARPSRGVVAQLRLPLVGAP